MSSWLLNIHMILVGTGYPLTLQVKLTSKVSLTSTSWPCPFIFGGTENEKKSDSDIATFYKFPTKYFRYKQRKLPEKVRL